MSIFYDDGQVADAPTVWASADGQPVLVLANLACATRSATGGL